MTDPMRYIFSAWGTAQRVNVIYRSQQQNIAKGATFVRVSTFEEKKTSIDSRLAPADFALDRSLIHSRMTTGFT